LMRTSALGPTPWLDLGNGSQPLVERICGIATMLTRGLLDYRRHDPLCIEGWRTARVLCMKCSELHQLFASMGLLTGLVGVLAGSDD
jgi:hypothetical protein